MISPAFIFTTFVFISKIQTSNITRKIILIYNFFMPFELLLISIFNLEHIKIVEEGNYF